MFCRIIMPPEAAYPLCLECQAVFVPAGLLCIHCERPIERKVCDCKFSGQALAGFFALTWYNRHWRKILHGLKYGSRRSLARPLGKWLGREIMDGRYFDADYIVPVPIHESRYRQRGYNQSALLAQYMGREMDLPVYDLLQKTVQTPPQTGLSRRDRISNMRGSFTCLSLSLQGSRVLLVDDVFTTGATVREASSELIKAGASVFGAVVAFNPRLN